jgi:tetratricopeptide (TPR) repeat protein
MKHTERRFHKMSLLCGICLWLQCGCADPPELPVLVEDGWAAYQAQDTETLQSVMTAAIKRDKRSVEVRFLRGLYLIRSGSPQASLVPLRDAARAESLRPRAAIAAAQAYYDLGQFQAVQQVLNDVLQQQPDNIDAHRLLAALYYDLGVNPRAIHHLETVSQLDLQDPRPHRLIGLMRKDFQDYPAAVEAYQAALARHPKPALAAEIRLELAESLISQREYAAALTTLAADDQSPDALTVRLQCLDSLGRREEAASIVTAAIALTEPPETLCATSMSRVASSPKPSRLTNKRQKSIRSTLSLVTNCLRLTLEQDARLMLVANLKPCRRTVPATTNCTNFRIRRWNRRKMLICVIASARQQPRLAGRSWPRRGTGQRLDWIRRTPQHRLACRNAMEARCRKTKSCLLLNQRRLHRNHRL